MKTTWKLSALSTLLLPLLAAAGAAASLTVPTDGAVLKIAPSDFMLMFNEAAKLAGLTLQKSGDKEPKDIGPLPAQASQHIMVPAPKLTSGEYTLRYRAIGADGQVVPGVVKFSIAP